VANDWDVFTLILAFGGGWALIAGVTLMVVKKANPRLKGTDQALVLWFVLCECYISLQRKMEKLLLILIAGSIHFFFEGYFVVNHTRMASMTDFFGQLWKEYSLSDSRYMFSDPFVLCMESITTVRPPSLFPPCFKLTHISGNMGTPLLLNSIPNHHLLPIPPPSPSPCLNRPVLRRRSLLPHQSIRSFLFREDVLSSRALLLLVLLRVYEYLLADCSCL
jgi:hypothetical protein